MLPLARRKCTRDLRVMWGIRVRGIARAAMEMEYGVLYVEDSLELHVLAIMAELRLMVVDDGWVVYFDKEVLEKY